MVTKQGEILVLFLVFFAQFTLAQDQTFSGKVVTNNGLPLPTVDIIIKGTIQGTITDIEGNYEINAKRGDVLVFSHIGLKTVE
ncbi:carboxypeptidase-like regulatory domain-containing protein, partial [uncultured Eudoraea sp.]|uniref:carboxypeptidase-like regulatory domain-containing protein n=1 Tax=uncultured Eudoraea sp. TaxID=1035614 RepID=UPI002606C5AD